MSTSRIQIAKADIFSFFDQSFSRVFKPKELAAILTSHRGFWRLAQSTNTTDFVKFLTDYGKLRLIDFKFPVKPEKCYVWGEMPLLQVLTHLKSGVHFSHYTAMRMHGLTEQIPKSIYMTGERSNAAEPGVLDLSAMIGAFSQPPRVSSNWVEYDGHRIYLLNGAHTDHLGVVKQAVSDDNASQIDASLTGLERTLIDIAVRPFYAGGVFEVAKAFEIAKNAVSINKLVAFLGKLNFTYPYHQAIGYYLERAGYPANRIDLLRGLPIKHDFYLVHGMGKTSYSKRWRLFVPEGF
jgi:hypothetical protein